MGLRADNVYTGYGRIKVLQGISIALGDGEILGVLGRNGMGKTTLIRCLAGLLPCWQGSISLDGEDVTRLPAHERARRGLTTIVQGRGLFPRLTVRENLEMGRIAGGVGKRTRLNEVIGYFPRLGERLGQVAGTLSGGEQQMLSIGRGLMTHPRLMLLDEPSDGIMPLLVNQIAEILVQINRNEKMAIIVVEQNVPMVFAMTDHCVIIEKGRVVAKGSRQEVSQSDVMREYLAI
jgi:ABC-type branched-subunit amino acid transport system ATPase component